MPQVPEEHRPALIEQYEANLAEAEAAQGPVDPAQGLTSEQAKLVLKIRESRLILDELRNGADTDRLESIGESVAMLGAIIQSDEKAGAIRAGIGVRILIELEEKDATIRRLRKELAEKSRTPAVVEAAPPPAEKGEPAASSRVEVGALDETISLSRIDVEWQGDP